MAEMALEQTLDFGDYLGAFRRRRGLIALVAGTVFLLGLITAFVWPPTYESSATILIEEQEIPVELITATVTSYAAQRIQVISQTVMTRNNMMEIIEKYNLYVDERKREPTEVILEEMREAIKIEMITAEVMDPRSGRPTAATIAFTVGFEGENPKLTQKVASELTTLYLNENLRNRTEKSAETYEFITEEAKRYQDQILKLEADVVAFNKKYANVLPENKALNTNLFDRTQREIRDIDNQYAAEEVKVIYLQGQMATMEPYALGGASSAAAQLEAMRSEYIRASTRYSPDHPDVIRLKHEIEALESDTGITDFTSTKIKQLDALHNELASAEEKYSAEHPDILRLRKQITALEAELAKQPPPSRSSIDAMRPKDPAYVNLETQLAAAGSNMRSLKAQRVELSEKLVEYEQRLLLTPQVESEYRALVREYENASMRFQTIKNKQMTAEVGKELEKERKGEKFTLIDPAVVPEEPVSPNRPAIIFLSLVLALGAGFGSAAVSESMDSAVRGAKGLVAILNTAPLAVIPYLGNAAETHAQKKRRMLIISSIIAGIIIILLLIHFLHTPLDVLWFRGMRKVDSVVGG
jgi:succinoglycan biosynthesis transport protein ExoP